jgi:hypothetical protein
MNLIHDNHRIRIKKHKDLYDFMNIGILLCDDFWNDYEIVSCKNKAGIYVISILDEYYKIGSSKNIYSRITNIERALPFEIHLVKIFETSSYKIIENHLHKKFSHKKIKTEWFRLSPQDIEELEDILNGFSIDVQS